jgi:hypothetical protein
MYWHPPDLQKSFDNFPLCPPLDSGKEPLASQQLQVPSAPPPSNTSLAVPEEGPPEPGEKKATNSQNSASDTLAWPADPPKPGPSTGSREATPDSLGNMTLRPTTGN